MAKSKLPRMQHLSWKLLCESWRINFITEHRVTEMMKMHPNLVGPSAVQPALDETRPITGANDAILGFGRASTMACCCAHSLSVHWMASNFLYNYAAWLAQFSSYERKINLLHRAVCELPG
jgi:hypothetical protein